MSVGPSANQSAPPRPRWYAPTPGKFLLAALLMQIGLYLSQHYQWFWFNRHKGYTVVIAVAATGALLFLLMIWLLARRLFQSKAQFSLAVLLLVIPVVALPCGWLGREMTLAKQRREILETIKVGNVTYEDMIPETPIPTELHKQLRTSLGKMLGDDFFQPLRYIDVHHVSDGDIEKIGSLGEVTMLMIRSGEVTDAGLVHLENLKGLKYLLVTSDKLTSAGLKHLANHKELESLHLRQTQVADDGLKELRDLTRLKSLYLLNAPVTDQGLQHLQGLTQLEILYLFKTQVTGKGLEKLQAMDHLTILSLEQSPVNDAGLRHVAQFPSLKQLSLSGTSITSSGLWHLKDLDKLEHLDLRQTSITNAGLEHLHGLSNLKVIELGKTRVTIEGAAKLLSALPKCDIEMGR